MESYGLIGFFVALQISVQVLDFGFGLTANRELARYVAGDDQDAGQIRNLIRTMEATYWGIGILIGAMILLLSPLLASSWLRVNGLPLEEVQEALRLMGLTLVFQWPLSFYQNCLNGLHQQVRFSIIRVVFASLLNGGAIAAMVLVAPTVQVFFVWQAGAGAVQILVLAATVWKFMPHSVQALRWEPSQLKRVGELAGGIGLLTLLGTFLTQMDKIVLSKMLPLQEFGYYTLGGVMASGLQLFITPIFSVVFPRLAVVVARGDCEAERSLYHEGTQLMSMVVLPTAIVLCVFAPQVLRIWTGDPVIAREVPPLAIGLLAGTAINGLMHLPYALQLAHAWISMSVRFAVLKILVFLPLLLWAATRYGAVGGAYTWLALNLTYMLIGVPLTHRRLLKGEAGTWLWRDVGLPLASILIVVLASRSLMPATDSVTVAVLEVLAAAVSAVLAALLVASSARRAVFKSIFAPRGART
jgi:O-antigen/teichoic acid export membrane protein